MRRLSRIPHVEHVRVIRPHTIELHFDDGLVRTLQFILGQGGPMFQPLDDPEFFARASVDHGTVAWPNGLDLDPAVLYGDVEAVGEPRFRETAPVTESHELA